MSALKEINPKIGFKEVLQSPTTYMLIVAVNMAIFLLYKYADRSDEVAAAKEKQITQLREERIDLLLEDRLKDRKIDSLQALILKRSDNSYEELKNMLDINNRESTIIIKPKKRK